MPCEEKPPNPADGDVELATDPKVLAPEEAKLLNPPPPAKEPKVADPPNDGLLPNLGGEPNDGEPPNTAEPPNVELLPKPEVFCGVVIPKALWVVSPPLAPVFACPPKPVLPNVELVVIPAPKELVLVGAPKVPVLLWPPNKLNCGLAFAKVVDPKIFLLALSSLGLLPSPLKNPPPLLAVLLPIPKADPKGKEGSCVVVLPDANGDVTTGEGWPNPDVPPELVTLWPNKLVPEACVVVPPKILVL